MDMDGQTSKNHVSDPAKKPGDELESQDNQSKNLQNKNGTQSNNGNGNESGEGSFQVGQVYRTIGHCNLTTIIMCVGWI